MRGRIWDLPFHIFQKWRFGTNSFNRVKRNVKFAVQQSL